MLHLCLPNIYNECKAVAFRVLPLISINQNLSVLSPIQSVCNTCCWLNNQLHLKQPTGTTIQVHCNSVFGTYCLDLLEIIACSRASAVGCVGLAVKQPSLHHKTQELFKITAPMKTPLCMEAGSKSTEGAAAPLKQKPSVNKNSLCFVFAGVHTVCVWKVCFFLC